MAAHGSPSLFDSLVSIREDVDFDTTNDDGMTPLQVAQLHKSKDDEDAEWPRSRMSQQIGSEWVLDYESI